MKILLTGASSFSGFWFARELSRRGYEVTAVFRARGEGDYTGTRGKRVKILSGFCRCIFGCTFGGRRFLSVAARPGWDALCHHAAVVGDFRSPDYNVAAALDANTRNFAKVLNVLKAGGCRAVVATGSVFESGEGKGTDGLPAILPYGLAKSLTWQSYVFYAREAQMRLAKFVIANPFGPLEEDRFTAMLAREWLKGRRGFVRAPDYVRDNIHISLLAATYADFVAGFAKGKKAAAVLRPSGYAEKQGDFARRYAAEMGKRWKLPCALDFAKHCDYREPMVRVNTDKPDITKTGWDEKAAWDAIADYYKSGNIAV